MSPYRDDVVFTRHNEPSATDGERHIRSIGWCFTTDLHYANSRSSNPTTYHRDDVQQLIH